MTPKERYDTAMQRFSEAMPIPETELHFGNNYQLIVAVILSAQCTDKRVNMITPALFEKYPTPQSLAEAKTEDVYELIKSCTYPNNKTRLLIDMAKMLVEKYDGQVPDEIDDLLSLPGVGRKTANVILAVAYDKPAMAVDTHVFRVSERIGFTRKSKTPYQTEKKLMKHIPEEIVPKAHHWLILHGRYVCKARKPLCHDCYLTDICRAFKQGIANPKPKPKKTTAAKAANKAATAEKKDGPETK